LFIDSDLFTKRTLYGKRRCNRGRELVSKERVENSDDIAKDDNSSLQMRTSISRRIFCSDASFSLIIHTSKHSCKEESD
jgi:hypothetical protein